ncbi:MAG: helix-turn-helix transcriptional regulator [Nocardioides sp.]|nr:helix-turn-helix transcriptional regulator [Nocardioides sp.]
MQRGPESLITALGYTRDQERLYVRLLSQSGRELVSAAQALLREPDELLREIEPFVARGVVRLDDGRIVVASPLEAVSLQVREVAETALQSQARLDQVGAALPFLTATGARPRPGEVHDVGQIDGEVSSGGNVPGLLVALIRSSQGDLLQLRPDQHRNGTPDPLVQVLRDVVSSGRRLRSIYPVRALQEAPDALSSRLEIGEEIRLLPEVPTRMLVLGTTHAILPEPLGFADEPRTLIRQRGLVDALTLWFEEMWDRAAPLSELVPVSSGPDLRRFLLQQLATGAQDEQIARRLSISLRTVRRRVAEVMAELGAESRFQAGVEAVRRGWL